LRVDGGSATAGLGRVLPRLSGTYDERDSGDTGTWELGVALFVIVFFFTCSQTLQTPTPTVCTGSGYWGTHGCGSVLLLLPDAIIPMGGDGSGGEPRGAAAVLCDSQAYAQHGVGTCENWW
jgi:hypothetical protein